METLVLETVQWASLPDIDDVEPLKETDAVVLREVGDLLRRHGVTARFGVCLLHRHFDLAPGEVLVEETDTEARVSTLRVQAKADSQGQGSSVETMWKFGKEPVCAVVCVRRCVYNGGHTRPHVREGR